MAKKIIRIGFLFVVFLITSCSTQNIVEDISSDLVDEIQENAANVDVLTVAPSPEVSVAPSDIPATQIAASDDGGSSSGNDDENSGGNNDSDSEDVPDSPYEPYVPDGRVVLYEAPLVSHNVKGFDVVVDYVRVADINALLYEQFVGSYMYAPDAWENARVSIEVGITFTNNTTSVLMDDSKWAAIVLSDGDDVNDVANMQDFNGPMLDGVLLNPQITSGIVNPGDSVKRFYQVTSDLQVGDISFVRFVFDCPIVSNDDGVQCFDATSDYDSIVDISLDGGEEQSLDMGYVFGSNYAPYGGYIERGGVIVAVDRIFAAPRASFPYLAERYDIDNTNESIVWMLLSYTNTASEPRFGYPDAGAVFTDPQDMEGIGIGDMYNLGSDSLRPMVVYPGETVHVPFWFGLPHPVSEDTQYSIFLDCVMEYSEELGEQLRSETDDGLLSPSELPPCLKDDKGEYFVFSMQMGSGYEKFDLSNLDLEWMEDFNVEAGIVDLSSDSSCDLMSMQQTLQSVIPNSDWGVKFQTNETNPPSLAFDAFLSGDTTEMTVESRSPLFDFQVDLAKVYYLDDQGDVKETWVATGISSGMYYEPFAVGAGWSSREEMLSIFSEAGRQVNVSISDWYVRPDGPRWSDCNLDQEYTDSIVCDLGLLYSDAAEYSSIPSDGEYFLYGWSFLYVDDVVPVCGSLP